MFGENVYVTTMSYLVATTCNPKETTRTWKRYSHLVDSDTTLRILVSEEESREYKEILKESFGKGVGIEIIRSKSSSQVDNTVTDYNLPSMQDIFSYMGSDSKYTTVCFMNSDLGISRESLRLAISIHEETRMPILLHRRDVEGEVDIGVYYHGIDMVLCSKEDAAVIAHELADWPELRVGVPGWDYWIGGTAKLGERLFLSEIDLRHQIHESGCGKAWADNILLVGLGWTKHMRVVMRKILALSKKMPVSVQAIKYVSAKIVFCLIISPRLRLRGWQIGSKPYSRHKFHELLKYLRDSID